MKLWRKAIYARDNWTCRKCKIKGSYLIAHHFQNFAQYSKLRFANDNGITFCKDCHTKFHKKYGYKNNNKNQVEEYINEKHKKKFNEK